MSEHNLRSFKALSPDKEARRMRIWHRVLDSKSKSHSPFSESSNCVCGLQRLAVASLGALLGNGLFFFFSCLKLSPLKGTNLFVEDCKIRLGRIFREIAP